jgi:hypothetical protein
VDLVTAALLAPIVGCLALAVAFHRRPIEAGIALAMVVVWAAALAVAGIGCRWEGFADGPLPVECRQQVAP